MGVKRSLFLLPIGGDKNFLKFFLDNDDNNGILGEQHNLTPQRVGGIG